MTKTFLFIYCRSRSRHGSSLMMLNDFYRLLEMPIRHQLDNIHYGREENGTDIVRPKLMQYLMDLKEYIQGSGAV